VSSRRVVSETKQVTEKLQTNLRLSLFFHVKPFLILAVGMLKDAGRLHSPLVFITAGIPQGFKTLSQFKVCEASL
jgi:hypothetical protein